MNGKRVSLAKISRPLLKGFLPRKRLFRLLDNARHTPTIWVSGPPGAGKTTLVSSYVETRKIPCLWYQVDEGDADVASFFHYLGMAGNRAAPRRKKSLPPLTPEYLPGLPVFTGRFFEELFNRLKAPSLLVLDDCWKVASDSLFFEALRVGLSRLPDGVNAVLLSRNDPHPAFARKRTHRLLEVVKWKDLRLTEEEAQLLARMRWKSKRPDAKTVRDLHGHSDGWAAGFTLLLELAESGDTWPGDAKVRTPKELLDYFGEEVYRRLDERTKDFLRKSAFLPKMTPGMARNLTGNPEAGSILSQLARRNYFTQRHPGEEPVFEYHALFREFLLDRAQAAYPADAVSGFRREAAAALLEGGQIEGAVELLRQADDYGELARVIVTNAPSLVERGRYGTLRGWLAFLPEDICSSEPWLLYWRGVSCLPATPGKSLGYFEEAFRKFDERHDPLGVFLSWSGAVDSILYEGMDYTQEDPWISILPGLLEKYGGYPSVEIGHRATCCMFHALVFRRLAGAETDEWADRSYAVFSETRDLHLKIESVMLHFLYKLGKGGFEGAETALASLRELLKRSDATPFMRLKVDWMEALLSIFVSRHERCLRVVSDAIALEERTGIHIMDPMFVYFGSISALHLGDGETVNRFLRRMPAAFGDKGTAASSAYHFVAACDALGRGDLRKSAFHMKEHLRLLEASGNLGPLPVTHVFAAHVRHALHEDEAAAGHLERARRIGSETENFHSFWLCALTESYIHLDRNRHKPAVASLREGLRIGREHGLFGTFFWRPGFLEKVASTALEEGIEVEYVRELIRRNRLLPDPGQPDLERWPWPVKVYTLGRFALQREEKTVEFSRKVQQKPLKLLKALVALGGRDVAKEQLFDILWPEVDGDLALQSFNVALHRLRQLIGEEKALELKEGRLSLSDRYCWVDSWAFERIVDDALDPSNGRGADGGNRYERLLEKALALYRGQFLADEPEEPYLVSMRERLRSRFLRAVEALGKRCEGAGRWEEAAACYLRGLDADDLAEELYRRIMACRIRQGRKAEALVVYRRCLRMLVGVLGVEPSPETVALSESVGRASC